MSSDIFFNKVDELIADIKATQRKIFQMPPPL